MPQGLGVLVQVVEDVASAMESGGSERSEFDKQLVDIIRFMDGKDANQLRDEFHRLVRPRTLLWGAGHLLACRQRVCLGACRRSRRLWTSWC